MSAALANVDLDDVRKRIEAGEYASRIAEQHGVSKQILSYHLRQLPDWQSTLQAGHETRLDTTDEQLEQAVAARDFDLARAREAQLKRREWRASVECPERWGQTNKLQVEHVGDLGERLRRARERVIPSEPVADAQQVQARELPSADSGAKE